MKMTPTSSITPSQLTPGWHPSFLFTITEEVTPTDWLMAKQSPTLYKWWAAVWESPEMIGRQHPEVQSGITSTKFTMRGRFQASNAYTWACQLLQRQLPAGAGVDWDEHLPLACRVKVTRQEGKDYIKIDDMEAWPEGTQYLSAVQGLLAQCRAEVEAATPPLVLPPPPVPAPAPPSPQAPQPGMQS
jgi:hypothetical protein